MMIQYRKKAVKYINSLSPEEKHRIKLGVEGLKNNPPKGDIKPMRGLNDGSFRLRIGRYRVIFRREIDSIIIDKIDVRGDVYK